MGGKDGRMSSVWSIRRSTSDKKLAGVCSGVARHWNVDPLLVRVGWVLLAFSGGVGVVLYIASMWIAGVMQGLMWRAVNIDGTLTYSFVESVKASYPFWAIRFLGGILFLFGMLIMAYNMVKTIAGGRSVDDARVVLVPAAHHA